MRDDPLSRGTSPRYALFMFRKTYRLAAAALLIGTPVSAHAEWLQAANSTWQFDPATITANQEYRTLTVWFRYEMNESLRETLVPAPDIAEAATHVKVFSNIHCEKGTINNTLAMIIDKDGEDLLPFPAKGMMEVQTPKAGTALHAIVDNVCQQAGLRP